MHDHGQDKRKYERFDTEVKIYFQVSYDLKTRVEYQILDKDKKETASAKYEAVSRNVSAEGLCFTSDKNLEKGELLFLEIYLPKQKEAIPMKGEVVWCRPDSLAKKNEGKFDTGVRLIMVDGKSVPESIYRDKEHGVVWSAVLDAVFGNFRIFAQKRNKF